MQAAIEATSTQLMLDVSMLIQKAVRFGLIAAKMQSSHQGNGDNLGIADPTLVIFPMVKCFQNIVSNAKNCYNLAVHVTSRFGCGLGNDNFTRSRMDFLFSYPR